METTRTGLPDFRAAGKNTRVSVSVPASSRKVVRGSPQTFVARNNGKSVESHPPARNAHTWMPSSTATMATRPFDFITSHVARIIWRATSLVLVTIRSLHSFSAHFRRHSIVLHARSRNCTENTKPCSAAMTDKDLGCSLEPVRGIRRCRHHFWGASYSERCSV